MALITRYSNFNRKLNQGIGNHIKICTEVTLNMDEGNITCLNKPEMFAMEI